MSSEIYPPTKAAPSLSTLTTDCTACTDGLAADASTISTAMTNAVNAINGGTNANVHMAAIMAARTRLLSYDRTLREIVHELARKNNSLGSGADAATL